MAVKAAVGVGVGVGVGATRGMTQGGASPPPPSLKNPTERHRYMQTHYLHRHTALVQRILEQHILVQCRPVICLQAHLGCSDVWGVGN